jgi:signal transduction histidine kinase
MLVLGAYSELMAAKPTSADEKMLAMNEALLLGSVRQHELTEAAENLNAQLRADITARNRAEVLVNSQKQALQLLAEDASLEAVLEFLIGVVERESGEGMLAAITLLNETGTRFQRGVGTSLPDAFNEAVKDVAVSSPTGLCAHAVTRREPMAVNDFNESAEWQAFAQFVAPYGLRSGWSTPIVSSSGRILGTFANYFRHVGDPTPKNRELVDMVIRTAAVAIERKQAEEALQKAKKLLEKRVRSRTAELHAANEELKNEIARRKGLEGQILEISDREQERLGQELHDGLCQQLTAIGFLTRAIALRLKDHRVVQTEDLEKIAQLINSSVMDARNIARDLHKEEIEAAEFLPALEDLVNRKIWKTPCRLDLKTDVNIEDDEVASQLYRILREALINANKHARATQIILEVRRLKNDLVFSVTDNGVGLSRKPKVGQGLGFHIMQYRAQSIGARLEFEAPKKGGSRVVCYLPLS